MNMVRASLLPETEEPAQVDCPVDDYSEHTAVDTGLDPHTAEPNESAEEPVVESADENTEEPVPITEDRVSVADTDTRLENLRY